MLVDGSFLLETAAHWRPAALCGKVSVLCTIRTRMLCTVAIVVSPALQERWGRVTSLLHSLRQERLGPRHDTDGVSRSPLQTIRPKVRLLAIRRCRVEGCETRSSPRRPSLLVLRSLETWSVDSNGDYA